MVLGLGNDRLEFATTIGVQMPLTSFSEGMSKILRTETRSLCFEIQPGKACKKYYNSVGSKLMREPDISV